MTICRGVVNVCFRVEKPPKTFPRVMTVEEFTSNRKERKWPKSCLAWGGWGTVHSIYRYIILLSPFQFSASKEQRCPTAIPETVNRLAEHCGGDWQSVFFTWTSSSFLSLLCWCIYWIHSKHPSLKQIKEENWINKELRCITTRIFLAIWLDWGFAVASVEKQRSSVTTTAV